MRLTTPVEQWIIPAIDVPRFDAARNLIIELAPHCGPIKLGLEQITASFFNHDEGDPYRLIRGLGGSIMFDIKATDVPRTDEGCIRAAAAAPGVAIITVSVESGPKALQDEVKILRQTAAANGVNRPLLAGITVLSSHTYDSLQAVGYFMGLSLPEDPDETEIVKQQRVSDLVDLRAQLALECGLTALVCGATQVGRLHKRFGDGVAYIVPGTRSPDAEHQDQMMVDTQEAAILNGATYLVMGSELKDAVDPVTKLHEVADRIRSALPIGV